MEKYTTHKNNNILDRISNGLMFSLLCRTRTSGGSKGIHNFLSFHGDRSDTITGGFIPIIILIFVIIYNTVTIGCVSKGVGSTMMPSQSPYYSEKPMHSLSVHNQIPLIKTAVPSVFLPPP